MPLPDLRYTLPPGIHIKPFQQGRNAVKIAAVFWAALASLLSFPSWGEDAFKPFEVPTAHTYPTRIAIDKSDTVWFIESNFNKPGELRPAKGVFSEHNIPTPSSL